MCQRFEPVFRQNPTQGFKLILNMSPITSFYCTIRLSTFNAKALDRIIKAISFFKKYFSKGGRLLNSACLPSKIKKFTVLKSPHVNKKSKEQFEIKQIKNLISIQTLSSDCLSTFLKFFKPTLPVYFVARVKVTKKYTFV